MADLTLSFLFPIPGLAPSSLSPTRFPGVSPESSIALQTVLKNNHNKWHIFFNEQRFHNHAAHRAIAAWALGANGSVIHAGYNKDIKYEKPAFKSPEEISLRNFDEHLGDDKYFNAYMKFFTCYVQEKGISDALEDFIFSCKANLGTNSTQAELPVDKQPRMLSRFLTGVLHPLIHTGYGAEFDLPGMIVEGLAQTAVHHAPADLVGPSLFFEINQVINKQTTVSAGGAVGSAFNVSITALDAIINKILPQGPLAGDILEDVKGSAENDRAEYAGNLTDTVSPSFPESGPFSPESGENIHALSILARIMRDSQFDSASTNSGEMEIYNRTIERYGNGIVEHVRAWTMNVSKLSEGDSGELNRKIEEVAWVVCVLYGIGGWTGRQGGSGGQFNADFFLMHLVTSSVFLPSICAFLSPSSKVRLLRAYFAAVCTWYVARGRPALDIAGFFSQELSLPSGLDPDPRKCGTPNLWIPLLQSAMVHPDEHLVKTQRALSCWAQKFGTKRARVLIKDDLEDRAGLDVSNENSSSGKDPVQSSPVARPADDTSRNTVNGIDTMPITELPGFEHLDGTLFLRTGLLTAVRLGWVREGQNLGEFWDFTGFFTETNGEPVKV